MRSHSSGAEFFDSLVSGSFPFLIGGSAVASQDAGRGEDRGRKAGGAGLGLLRLWGGGFGFGFRRGSLEMVLRISKTKAKIELCVPQSRLSLEYFNSVH